MSTRPTMESTLTVKQAYLVMFEFLEREYKLDPSSDLGGLLGSLSLWETTSGTKEPMDGAVFPQWLECAELILNADSYQGADILLNGEPPKTKVVR
jgi:hypothetical protein